MGRMQGRLLFGAVRTSGEAEIRDVQDSEPYDRFALPAETRFSGGILDLRRLFMVDVRDVYEARADRTASLTDEQAAELAVRWAAYANRRGPLVALRNSENLAKLASRSDAPEFRYLEAVQPLVELVKSSWQIEDSLEETDEMLRQGMDAADLVRSLLATLDSLAATARLASDGLRTLSR